MVVSTNKGDELADDVREDVRTVALRMSEGDRAKVLALASAIQGPAGNVKRDVFTAVQWKAAAAEGRAIEAGLLDVLEKIRKCDAETRERAARRREEEAADLRALDDLSVRRYQLVGQRDSGVAARWARRPVLVDDLLAQTRKERVEAMALIVAYGLPPVVHNYGAEPAVEFSNVQQVRALIAALDCIDDSIRRWIGRGEVDSDAALQKAFDAAHKALPAVETQAQLAARINREAKASGRGKFIMLHARDYSRPPAA